MAFPIGVGGIESEKDTSYKKYEFLLLINPHRSSKVRYLIFNADDFGMSEGVKNGIVEAWNVGFITLTSIMPMAPVFENPTCLTQR